MAEITTLVCDKCGSDEDVHTYRLSTPQTGPNRAVAADLCVTCAKPIHEIEAIGRTVSRSKRAVPRFAPGRGGETIRAKIYTQAELDEIEEAGGV